MPKLLPVAPPLQQMRKEAGLSAEDVAKQMTDLLGRRVSPAYVKTLEYRGTNVYGIIEAFAKIYGKSLSSVAGVARQRPGAE